MIGRVSLLVGLGWPGVAWGGLGPRVAQGGLNGTTVTLRGIYPGDQPLGNPWVSPPPPLELDPPSQTLIRLLSDSNPDSDLDSTQTQTQAQIQRLRLILLCAHTPSRRIYLRVRLGSCLHLSIRSRARLRVRLRFRLRARFRLRFRVRLRFRLHVRHRFPLFSFTLTCHRFCVRFRFDLRVRFRLRLRVRLRVR